MVIVPRLGHLPGWLVLAWSGCTIHTGDGAFTCDDRCPVGLVCLDGRCVAATGDAATAIDGPTGDSGDVDAIALVNRLDDPGFETGLDGWRGFAAAVTRVEPGRGGNGWALRVCKSGTPSTFSAVRDIAILEDVPVGTQFVVAAWTRTDPMTPVISATVGLALSEASSSGPPPAREHLESPQPAATSDWTFHQFEVSVVDAGHDWVSMSARGVASGGCFLVDDAFAARR